MPFRQDDLLPVNELTVGPHTWYFGYSHLPWVDGRIAIPGTFCIPSKHFCFDHTTSRYSWFWT